MSDALRPKGKKTAPAVPTTDAPLKAARLPLLRQAGFAIEDTATDAELTRLYRLITIDRDDAQSEYDRGERLIELQLAEDRQSGLARAAAGRQAPPWARRAAPARVRRRGRGARGHDRRTLRRPPEFPTSSTGSTNLARSGGPHVLDFVEYRKESTAQSGSRHRL